MVLATSTFGTISDKMKQTQQTHIVDYRVNVNHVSRRIFVKHVLRIDFCLLKTGCINFAFSEIWIMGFRRENASDSCAEKFECIEIFEAAQKSY